MSFQRRRRIEWVLLILALPTVGWSAQSNGALFSSPTAIRENAVYFQTHNDGTNLPPFDGAVFKSVAVDLDGEELTIKYGTAEEPAKMLYGAVTRHTVEG